MCCCRGLQNQSSRQLPGCDQLQLPVGLGIEKILLYRGKRGNLPVKFFYRSTRKIGTTFISRDLYIMLENILQ